MSSSNILINKLAHVRPSWINHYVAKRYYYYKFARKETPPLQKPLESPYIVGPYLKPKYLPVEYITEPLKSREVNDFNHFIYEPTKIEPDETRTVKLLLIEDVEGLGLAGHIIDAPYRFGASKLVAMKKAEYATEFAKKWYKFTKTSKSASSALSPRTARLLRTQVFKLAISQNVEVKQWHISIALRLAGCFCPIEAVDGNSIVKKDDQVQCIIRINNHEEVTVRFSYQ